MWYGACRKLLSHCTFWQVLYSHTFLKSMHTESLVKSLAVPQSLTQSLRPIQCAISVSWRNSPRLWWWPVMLMLSLRKHFCGHSRWDSVLHSGLIIVHCYKVWICTHWTENSLVLLKISKVVPCSINEHWAQSRSRFLGSQPAGDLIIKLVVGCHYFPSGPQLPSLPKSITAPWPVPNYTAR